MSKILAVVYSCTGTSRRLAQLLVAQRQWPLDEVRDARPRNGLAGTSRCLPDSLFRRCPEIRYDGPNPAEFDAVVLISPIGAYRLAGPMRSFVAARVAARCRGDLGDGRKWGAECRRGNDAVDRPSTAEARDSSLVVRPSTWSQRAA